VIDAPVGAHSAKPERFYEIIESYYPSLPKIELNARVARPGWVRWGYEAPDERSDTIAACPQSLETDQRLSIAGPKDTAGRQSVDTLRAERERPGDGVTAGETAPPNSEQIDDMLRAGDVARTSLAELVQNTGLTLDQVKKRRKKLGIASRDRQREAVAEANRRRGAK